MISLAENIAAARAAKGYTQRQVAVALGVDTLAVSRWENGRARPNPTNLVALAEVLGRTPAWFYTDHSPEDVAA